MKVVRRKGTPEILVEAVAGNLCPTCRGNDAKEYVVWLNRRLGLNETSGYRLLSEAEWEYAARAHTTTTYSWGNGVGVGNANCWGCGSKWDQQAAPVGSFEPNPFGLYDMHGNVLEWVEDCYQHSYEEAPKDGSLWTNGDCRDHVLRGGSWFSPPWELRSAARKKFTLIPTTYYGFRLGRTLSP